LSKQYKNIGWLPVTRKEVEERGWEQTDVILVTGDAYVDHPSFGTAVIGRVLEAIGLKVAVIPQPNWKDDLRDFKKMGKPRLFFGVTAGNMDSMMNHYTAARRLRSDDAYTPGGKPGFRPDRAVTVYTKILKSIYPEVPVIIGGIEASLRRVTHYDYWADELKPSVLFDSGADLMVYGMGEKAIRRIVTEMDEGKRISQIVGIPQTAFLSKEYEENNDTATICLPSHENCLKDKKSFASMFAMVEVESNKLSQKRIVQKTGDQVVVINPPYAVLSTPEMDEIYDLPFTRLPHPKYNTKEPIPAYEMIRHSVNIHRGCFGGCSFCTISAHQGKFISSRSEESVLKEVEAVTHMSDFKGYISDLGGPTANMYRMQGVNTAICEKCSKPSCVFPSVCHNLSTDHNPLLALYRKASVVSNVKQIFIGSGIRYDLFLGNKYGDEKKYAHGEYLEQLVLQHVSGRLKVAPEHTSENVLRIMRKPPFTVFMDFRKKFELMNRRNKLNQQIVPYFISGHPGSKPEDMAELAVITKDLGFKLEQVQDFTPTPMTLSSVIYYSGIDPYTHKQVFSALTSKQKTEQMRFFFWYKKENRSAIRSYLIHAGKPELLEKLTGEKERNRSNFRKK